MGVNLISLQTILGYHFNDASLLEHALTHRSYQKSHNERLEFLGDSLLGLVISHDLFIRFPEASEGQLSQLRSNLVKKQSLVTIAQGFKLGNYIRLGSGELKSGGFRRDSILADCLEAIIGSIYLDSDFLTVSQCLLNWYQSVLEPMTLASAVKDPKTQLQEYAQSKAIPLPVYTVEAIEGKPHERLFKVNCTLDGLQADAQAPSRQQAERLAAEMILKQLQLL